MNRNMMTSPGVLQTQHWLTAQLSSKEGTVQCKVWGAWAKREATISITKKKKLTEKMDKLPKLGWKKSITIANKRKKKKGNKKRCLYSAYLGPGTTSALHILAHLSSELYDINTIITSFLLMRTLEQKNEKCVRAGKTQARVQTQVVRLQSTSS